MHLTLATFLSDLGGLWPLVLSLVVLILGFIFRKPIQLRIERGGFRLSKGDASVEIMPTVETAVAADVEAEGEEAPPPPDASAKARLERASSDGETQVDDDSEDTAGDAGEAESPSYLDLFNHLRSGQLAEAREVFDALNADEDVDEEKKRRNDLLFVHWRYSIAKDQSARAELERFTEDEELRSAATRFLGDAQREGGFLDEAIATYRDAIKAARSPDDRVSAVIGLSQGLAALGEMTGAADELMDEAATAPKDQQGRLFSQLAEIYRETDEWLLRALALEKALEASADTAPRRFELGYAYSQAGREDLSLLHYKAAVSFDSDSTFALNNLGVAYERLEMPIKAVRSYSAASDDGVTLATANLANRLLRAGFLDQALEMLHEAVKVPDASPNVASHLASADEKLNLEQRAEENSLAEASREREFLRKYADARLVGREAMDLSGVWMNGTSVEIAQDRASFVGTLTTSEDKEARWVGEVKNRAFTFEYLVEEYRFSTTPATKHFAEKGAGQGYLDDQGAIVVALTQGSQRSTERLERAAANT